MKLAKLVIPLLLFAIFPLASGTASSGNDEMEAQAVLTRYFDALIEGDTTTLQSLMGGPLLKKRTRLLNNPAYPAYLIKTYGTAHFSIDKTEIIGEFDITIDTSIIFDKDNTSYRQFQLHKELHPSDNTSTFRIYSENEPDI